MQETYLQYVFVCYNMFHCNLNSTSLEVSTKILRATTPKFFKKTSTPYGQTIATLMHNNVNTQPNYFFTINSLV